LINPKTSYLAYKNIPAAIDPNRTTAKTSLSSKLKFARQRPGLKLIIKIKAATTAKIGRVEVRSGNQIGTKCPRTIPPGTMIITAAISFINIVSSFEGSRSKITNFAKIAIKKPQLTATAESEVVPAADPVPNPG
jgi:hypothetical protein